MKDCTKCQSHSELTLTDIVNQKRLLDKMKHRIDTSIVLMEMQLKNMITDHIEKRFFQCHKIKDSVEDAVSSFPMEEASFQNKIHIALQHDFAVSGDGLLTKHLLWNLLNNALHFIKEEGRGEVFITTEEMIEYYLLRFKDTAKGMPVSETKKVFEPLYTTRNNGSGLGLHFCQLVMKAYGGKIECCAQEGKQTEFLLFFPKKQSKK